MPLSMFAVHSSGPEPAICQYANKDAKGSVGRGEGEVFWGEREEGMVVGNPGTAGKIGLDCSDP